MVDVGDFCQNINTSDDFFNSGTNLKDVKMNPNDVSVGSSEDYEMMDANANPKNNHNIAKK